MTVYYEDTDLAGIVYYANYLRFIERGRTEALGEYGVDQGRLKAETGLVFAVRRMAADWLSPARFGDRLVVATAVSVVGAASAVMAQEVRRGAEVLFRAEVTIACIRPGEGSHAKPARIPPEIRAMLLQISRGAAAGH